MRCWMILLQQGFPYLQCGSMVLCPLLGCEHAILATISLLPSGIKLPIPLKFRTLYQLKALSGCTSQDNYHSTSIFWGTLCAVIDYMYKYTDCQKDYEKVWQSTTPKTMWEWPHIKVVVYSVLSLVLWQGSSTHGILIRETFLSAANSYCITIVSTGHSLIPRPRRGKSSLVPIVCTCPVLP